jgi:hypothetical protein
VLLVDFRTPNDAILALRVGEAFLSMPDDDIAAPQTSARMAEEPAGPLLPPRTGDGGFALEQKPELPVWAGVLWAGLSVAALALAIAGGIALLRAARR